MLFKNLLFAGILAGHTLASPLVININVDSESSGVKNVHHSDEEYPYQDYEKKLEGIADLVGAVTGDVVALHDAGSDGFETLTADMKKLSKGLLYASKNLPEADLGEGETAQVQPYFEYAVSFLHDMCEFVESNNATIIKLDYKDDFYRLFTNDRNAWFQFFYAMRGHLYKCDADEKRNGCEGTTPFNRYNTQVTADMLKVQNIFRKKSGNGNLVEQFDL